MATSLGGPDEHGEVRPSAALLPRTRATDRQREHYDSLARRHPTTLSPRVDSGKGQDRTLRGKVADERAIDGWF